jgi:hypothetical protein
MEWGEIIISFRRYVEMKRFKPLLKYNNCKMVTYVGGLSLADISWFSRVEILSLMISSISQNFWLLLSRLHQWRFRCQFFSLFSFYHRTVSVWIWWRTLKRYFTIDNCQWSSLLRILWNQFYFLIKNREK